MNAPLTNYTIQNDNYQWLLFYNIMPMYGIGKPSNWFEPSAPLLMFLIFGWDCNQLFVKSSFCFLNRRKYNCTFIFVYYFAPFLDNGCKENAFWIKFSPASKWYKWISLTYWQFFIKFWKKAIIQFAFDYVTLLACKQGKKSDRGLT